MFRILQCLKYGKYQVLTIECTCDEGEILFKLRLSEAKRRHPVGMDAFLGRALTKIKNELKSGTSKNSKAVVKACSEALGNFIY